MRFRLNDKVVEYEPRRITDVAELQRRMARGALLYWTMVRPKHAVLFDPEQQTVAQLGVFRELWSLQRSNKIRHDRYEGIYQVFVPTTKAESACAARLQADPSDTLFAQSAPAESASAAGVESILFNPSI
jgi:hypothetical protein